MSLPDWIILAGFCIVFSLQVLGAVSQKSATYDEPLNLVSGYVSLRFEDVRLLPQNLPLMKLLAASPLLFGNDLALPAPPRPWSEGAQYLYASQFVYELNDGDALLWRGRIALLPLALVMGCVTYVWAKQLSGKTAAIVALVLYGFEPNVLAHSGLITSDIATACFMVLTLFGWYHLMRVITWPRLLLTSLALGLALISKFTSLFLFPIMLLSGVVLASTSLPFHLQLNRSFPRSITGRGHKIFVVCLSILGMGLLSCIVIWASYRFHYASATMPVETYPTPWSVLAPSSPFLHQSLRWMRDLQLLPEAYLYGFSALLRLSGEFPSYLMGDIRPGGWWYYFFVTFAIKTPIPFVVLVILSLTGLRSVCRRQPDVAALLILPIIVYFAAISASNWKIGHRHLLPIYPLLFIWVSAWVSLVIGQGRWIRVGMGILACWYVLSSTLVFPHYLAYFNELVGGPANGHHYLVDSNLDWGQDLKGLKRYLDEQHIERVWLSYFGQASPDYYGILYDYLPSLSIYDYKNEHPDVDRLARLPALPGVVAISATLLQGDYLARLGFDPAYFEQYRHLTPIATIGHSIFVYRIE
jgi:hypothetical protein